MEKTALKTLIAASYTSAPARAALRAWALAVKPSSPQESGRLLHIVNDVEAQT